MDNKAANILADAFESVRNLTKLYFSKLDDKNYYDENNINGVKINTAFWLLAHLVWTEHSLIVYGIGNREMEIPWLDKYAFGSDPGSIESQPSLEELRDKFEKVHALAMEIIRNLSDEQLEEDNHIGASFGSSKSKKSLLVHVIRHEPMHIGQLSLILKSNGVKLT
ncbi:MAG TPA: DinB family protein [Ignavibacteria bacterium]|nr:DinB family protein [Ignavibacteria bacterium]HRJ99738.1 DinB family protein [Ignavibacteria bacterium]